MTHCQLNAEPFSQCCCNCTLRVTDHKHCSIHGRSQAGCVCHEVKGFVCLGLAYEGRVHSEWAEHSCGCELYMPRVGNAEAVGIAEYSSWFDRLEDRAEIQRGRHPRVGKLPVVELARDAGAVPP
jgi:hypothetical protein